MSHRHRIAILALCAALFATGCGEDDRRTERGELIPRLSDAGLTIKYRSVKAPEGLPVLETVTGRARDGDGPEVDFALIVWEPAYPDRRWHPVVAGAQPSGSYGNVELLFPPDAPKAVADTIRDAVRDTAPEAR